MNRSASAFEPVLAGDPTRSLRVLRTRELCELLGIHRSTLWRWRTSGFPRPVQLGRAAIGWRLVDVEAWLNTRQRSELASEPTRDG